MARNVANLTDLQSDAWLQLIAISELLPAALDAQLRRDSHLTHFEYAVLSLVQLSPLGALSPSDIAKPLNATLPRLSHVLTRLERGGLITRAVSRHDRRSVEVRLTTEGRQVVVKGTPGHIETARAVVLDQFSDDELEVLGGLLRRITDRLDPSDRLGHAVRAR